MSKVNLAEKFAQIDKYWDPKVAGELNGQSIKLAKLKGEFIWHTHDNEDEFFLVVRGHLTLRLRSGDIELDEGEFFIVPKGVEHLPVADEEAHIMMFEPNTTVNTGNIESDRTITDLEKI